MSFSIQTQTQRTTNRNGGGVDINRLRALIAKHLNVEIGRVTDDAHLSRDLGADWLDRLELVILVEEIAGVEITDSEADRIDIVGDLISLIDER
jgi:acyl carrier protein